MECGERAGAVSHRAPDAVRDATPAAARTRAHTLAPPPPTAPTTHLRVLHGRDGVGEAGASRDRCDAGYAGQPGDGIGGKHGVDLVPHVDNADALRLGRDEDRGDVAAHQREQELDTWRTTGWGVRQASVRATRHVGAVDHRTHSPRTVLLEHAGNELAAVLLQALLHRPEQRRPVVDEQVHRGQQQQHRRHHHSRRRPRAQLCHERLSIVLQLPRYKCDNGYSERDVHHGAGALRRHGGRACAAQSSGREQQDRVCFEPPRGPLLP